MMMMITMLNILMDDSRSLSLEETTWGHAHLSARPANVGSGSTPPAAFRMPCNPHRWLQSFHFSGDETTDRRVALRFKTNYSSGKFLV